MTGRHGNVDGDVDGEVDVLPAPIDDAALVRAPRWLVHRRLRDVAGWPTWWPGMTRLRLVVDGDHRLHHLELARNRPWRPRRVLRLVLLPHGHRPDNGLRLVVAGDVVADAEFWLEDVSGGTLVHHVAQVHGPHPRAAVRWREQVRRGLWAFGDRLAAEVRDAVVAPDAGGGRNGR